MGLPIAASIAVTHVPMLGTEGHGNTRGHRRGLDQSYKCHCNQNSYQMVLHLNNKIQKWLERT